MLWCISWERIVFRNQEKGMDLVVIVVMVVVVVMAVNTVVDHLDELFF